GNYPIIDQGEKFIGGFYNEDITMKLTKPVVIFGDHSKCVKYVDFNFILGADGVKVLETSEALYPKFLYFFLQSIELPDVGYSRHFKFLKEMEIPLPPLPTQEKIAAILDNADELRRKDQELLKKYDELAQAIFIDMFGDPVRNEKGWEVKKLEEVCLEIIDCPHSTPKKSKSITKYPCIRTSEIQNGHIKWDSMQYLNEDEYLKRIKRLEPLVGDIGYAREGRFGDAVILPQGFNFCLGQRTMLMRANGKQMNNIFLCKQLRSDYVYRQALKMNNSSTVGHVNVKDIKKFDIQVPPLSLQEAFAKKIELINQLKAKVNAEKSEDLFQSLLQRAFKGELTI